MTQARLAFIERLRAADCSWDQYVLVSLSHAASTEIERLSEMAADLQAQLDGAVSNRLYDHRDGYYDGLDDGEDAV